MGADAQQIKARIDLVEYCASMGIELKPIGAAGEYRGLCPFHQEQEPSFHVNRRRGLWHCFGCGAGGDVISLQMKRSGGGFKEALTVLAGLGRQEPGEVRAAAAGFWQKCLVGSPSAQAYLKRRGIDDPGILERYRVGFAPGRTRTRDWLLAEGFPLEQVESSGLVNHRGLDAFFGRVTFPLVEGGTVVNIYGRSLSERYRHLYLPGRRDVIFNIDRVEGERAILTESVFDTLSLVVLGYPHAVSGLSVHLTQRQVEVLAARFRRIRILFDGDAAGETGARRAAELLQARGVEVSLATPPADADANSLLTAGISRQEMDRLLGEGAG